MVRYWHSEILSLMYIVANRKRTFANILLPQQLLCTVIVDAHPSRIHFHDNSFIISVFALVVCLFFLVFSSESYNHCTFTECMCYLTWQCFVSLKRFYAWSLHFIWNMFYFLIVPVYCFLFWLYYVRMHLEELKVINICKISSFIKFLCLCWLVY